MTAEHEWWVRFYDALKILDEQREDVEPVDTYMGLYGCSASNIGLNVTPRQAAMILQLLEREVENK